MAKPKQHTDLFLKFSVIISIFGLASVPLILLQPANTKVSFLFNQPLIGSIYVAVCMLGIVAVFNPKKCQRTFSFKTKAGMLEEQESGKTKFSGHHPDCEKFSPNRIKLHGSPFCASCTGLLIGAVGALVGVVLYFFVGLVPPFVGFWVVFVGYFGLVLGLLQFRFAGYVKLVANALFVLGSLVVLVLADLISASLMVDLYVLGVIVFLLATRILISQWNNRRICLGCGDCYLADRR